MKLHDWSAECWSFLIGCCSFKMNRGERKLRSYVHYEHRRHSLKLPRVLRLEKEPSALPYQKEAEGDHRTGALMNGTTVTVCSPVSGCSVLEIFRMSGTTPSTQQCVVNVADKHYTTSYYHCYSCFTAYSHTLH